MKKQKTVKVEVVQSFRDWDNNLELRKAGTTYEVPEERAKYLQARRIVKILKRPDPKAVEPPDEEKIESEE